MMTRSFDWLGAVQTAVSIRDWAAGEAAVDVGPIEREVREGGDEALRRLTARFDGFEPAPGGSRVDPAEGAAALAGLDRELRTAMELCVANVRAVAEAAFDKGRVVSLPQGQTVELREAPVAAAGIYAPGGRAAYPTSVIMCCVPARVAGVERLALVTPPSSDGRVAASVLAAAELCGVEEIYAVGGAQAIFALAYGTETIAPVDVIAGPGNAWVREAKRAVAGRVGIDSLAGPSELLVVADRQTDPGWAALDLCAQAEHGSDSPLALAAQDATLLGEVEEETRRIAAERPSVADARLALVQVPDLAAAAALAEALAPEHVELLGEEAGELARDLSAPGCVFVGSGSATAFGDYVAGSNHVLPTGGAGRFSGPLGPAAFRRGVAVVTIPEGAARELAPYVEVLAGAEGLPVHGESAMIRREEGG
jgi:histidinol dehydrogenase